MALLENLKLLTNESNEELLSLLLEMSKNTILEMTNRNILPKRLEVVQLKLATIAYNRMGTEGETSRSEGGISSAFSDLPEDIKIILSKNRLCKVGGHIYEKTDETQT